MTASDMVSKGTLPPFIIVGIDHAGTQGSYEYTPCKPGTGPANFRKDAKEWPGGGVDEYLERLVKEIIPFMESNYGCTKDPNQRFFGGSSLGAICALCAGMK